MRKISPRGVLRFSLSQRRGGKEEGGEREEGVGR